ncbi:hypothetical protein KP509_22G076200 [Ceratopteris richardii]|uniref:Uncharacterized protein n=1 Tax=Ceratopteris richardii TaxID=49495 RepID=A0A8T2S9E5_CERRI|nr:hypothetical protein KP509_22G076200 [Ceratopteris richardii]
MDGIAGGNTITPTTADVKKRIEDAVKQRQEAVAVTTEIQEELLEEMGVEAKFGISCLGKVNAVYKDDRELMLRFYTLVTKEELACDEAELGSHAVQLKMQQFERIQDQVCSNPCRPCIIKQ